MKKILLGAIATVVLSSTAFAADLPARTYTKAPAAIVSPIYNWSGFYIGANGGGGWSDKCWYDAGTPQAPNAVNVFDGCHNTSGATAGGQIGYRWQSAAFVFGLEAQGNWANLTGSSVSIVFPTLTNQSKIDGFGFFTGQIGYSWNNALLYVKGGAAVVSDKYNYFTTLSPINGAKGDASETRWGAVVGVGFEYGFTPNWSFAIEYDHAFFGRRDLTFNQFINQVNTNAFFVSNIRQDLDVVTARINYRFGGPVVAKY